nr:2'-5' RNA ligase family protein [Salaquimonas pukyongi]
MSRRGPRKGDIATALRAAARVRVHGFDIGFDRLCAFGRGERRAIVLRCSSGASPASSLRRNLIRELVRSGLWWGRGKFTPHLTLLWDRSPVPEICLDAPICWTVRDFVLVRSLVGCSRHIDLGRWPLALPPM